MFKGICTSLIGLVNLLFFTPWEAFGIGRQNKGTTGFLGGIEHTILTEHFHGKAQAKNFQRELMILAFFPGTGIFFLLLALDLLHGG